MPLYSYARLPRSVEVCLKKECWFSVDQMRFMPQILALLLFFVQSPGLFATRDEALFNAALENNATAVSEALKNGANVNAVDQYGRTALRLAVEKNNTHIVKLLIAAKVDLNAAPDPDNVTALMVAAANGYPEMIRVLLQANADANFRNKAGRTALRVAIIQGKHGAADLLKAAGGTESGASSAANSQNAKKRKASGFKVVDAFLDGCSVVSVKKGQISEEICPGLAECIVQGIYKDPFVCTMRNCSYYQKPISAKKITACASDYSVKMNSTFLGEQLADWAWTQKTTETAAPSGSNSNYSRPGYQPSTAPPAYDYHKENRDFNRYKGCLNSGQRGCQ